MDEIRLMELRYAFVKIKTQCWIDTDGKCHWLDIKRFCTNYNGCTSNTIADAISIHGIILNQVDEGVGRGEEYYSKIGWIPYNSFLGSRNRCGLEPTQSQINTMYDLRGLEDRWEKILRY